MRDLIGKRFGLLLVCGRTNNSRGRNYWVCRCDCGNEKLVNTHDLTSGKVHSCGCIRRKDLTGQKFGYLTVIKASESKSAEGRRMWVCECCCGNLVERDTKALTSHKTRSCGCKRATLHNLSDKCVKHGESGTRLYGIWTAMRSRCNSPTSDAYRNYGGRGISVCKEWENYESFAEWAIHNGYRDDLTIDRIDVNGNYEPSNCRWATNETQANNKRTSRYVENDGEVHTISEWARITGLNKTLIAQRLNRGWSPSEALTIPAVPGGAVRHNGTFVSYRVY